VPLLALTVAYGFTAMRNGTTRRALPFFGVSYVLLGLTIDFELRLMVKKFAPSEPTFGSYIMSVGMILFVMLAVTLIAVHVHRAARAGTSRPS
jgi:DMSO/TMAO reductase YedYZ heme-binding membrane subunit